MTSTIAIPESTAKEWVSMAYIRGIAAQAGLNIKHYAWDDGIDLEIGTTKLLPGFPPVTNCCIGLQVKSTSNWSISSSEEIRFPLKAHNYEKLIDTHSFISQFLVLYTLPPSRSRWLTQRKNSCEFKNNAYFLSLRGREPLAPRANGKKRYTRTVAIPTTNRLTACSLLRLYRNACNEALASMSKRGSK